jgi:hypothetical protein
MSEKQNLCAERNGSLGRMGQQKSLGIYMKEALSPNSWFTDRVQKK